MHSISIVGGSPQELMRQLQDADIECFRHGRRMGEIVNDAGAVLEIVKWSWPALAAVLVAWVKTRPSRKLSITTKDNEVIHAEGRSVSEVQQLLETAQSIMAIAPNERERKQAEQVAAPDGE